MKAAAYDEFEEDEVPAKQSWFQSTLQSLKQWATSMIRPQHRRRGRTKAYKMWISMVVRTLLLALVISIIATMLAPSAARQDSSCRLMLDSVRRACKDTFGVDCRSLATKARSLCYITER